MSELIFNILTVFSFSVTSLFLLKKILRKLKGLLGSSKNTRRRSFGDSFQRWTELNSHNETWLEIPCDISKISVGKKTYGPINCVSTGGTDSVLKIGSYVSIAKGTKFLLSGEHNLNTISTYPFKAAGFKLSPEGGSKGDILVGDDVWIGENALILSGVKIGRGAVVGAASLVTKDIPPYAIAVGSPAKVIRYRFDGKKIEKLLKLDLEKLFDTFTPDDFDDIYAELTDELLDKFQNRIAENRP